MDSPTRPAEFDGPFLDVVRAVIRRSYELAKDHYDPDIGVDGQIFAFAVYKIAAHQFEIALTSLPDATITWNGRGREIVRGGKRLRWNKVGTSRKDAIDTSFPSRSRSAAAMAEANAEQLDLGFGEAEPVNWIIAHLGNPADGLCALYLAAPIESRGGQVTGWQRWIPIFDINRPDDGFPVLPAPGPLEPLPADLGALELDLFDETDEETQRG